MSRKIQEIRNGKKSGPVTSYVSSTNIASLNPFVLWDHFHIPDVEGTAGFDFHGHSGVAAISYPQVGNIEHEDSGGHEGVLRAGGVQVLAAGSGVLHKETVHPEKKVADAFQLWTALPAVNQEMGDATYSTAQKDTLPTDYEGGVTIKVVVGSYNGKQSPVQAPVDMTYLHVHMKVPAVWRHPVEHAQTTAFIYVRFGRVVTGGLHISAGELGVFEPGNELVEVESLEQDTEFLVISGAPLEQTIISNGSSVHSTAENLVAGVQRIKRLQTQMTQV